MKMKLYTSFLSCLEFQNFPSLGEGWKGGITYRPEGSSPAYVKDCHMCQASMQFWEGLWKPWGKGGLLSCGQGYYTFQ